MWRLQKIEIHSEVVLGFPPALVLAAEKYLQTRSSAARACPRECSEEPRSHIKPPLPQSSRLGPCLPHSSSRGFLPTSPAPRPPVFPSNTGSHGLLLWGNKPSLISCMDLDGEVGGHSRVPYPIWAPVLALGAYGKAERWRDLTPHPARPPWFFWSPPSSFMPPFLTPSKGRLSPAG